MKKLSFRRDNREKRRKLREPFLGNYIIVTNTDCTEYNYFEGLKDSLSSESKNNVKIQIFKNIKSRNLVEHAQKLYIENPQFSKPYIVFDRDEEKDFNNIIISALENEITPCWSNPCFEIWLYSYFDNPPNCDTSRKCCNDFSRLYLKFTQNKYSKNDKKIYSKLIAYGDEKMAICRAITKLNNNIYTYGNDYDKMIGSSTVYLLVEELKAY